MTNTVFFSNDEFEIRPAKNTDEFKDLWWGFMQELSWDRCYYDLETYMNPSIGSGMILLIDKKQGNKPIGHVATVANANGTGWVAMFIIHKDYRGGGLGRHLFNATAEDARRSGVKVLGLDGVPEQRATYGRRGFVETPSSVVAMMGRPLLAHAPLPSGSDATPKTEIVVDIRRVPFDLLVAHEAKMTGFNRPRLWSDEHMFHRRDVLGFALVICERPTNADDILAWTIVRRCSSGARIGPVYAHDADAARVVIVKALSAASAKFIKEIPLPNEPLSDLPEEEITAKANVTVEAWTGNPHGQELFESMGWKKVAAFHRMWLNGKATPQQEPGGMAETGVFAIFDAAVG